MKFIRTRTSAPTSISGRSYTPPRSLPGSGGTSRLPTYSTSPRQGSGYLPMERLNISEAMDAVAGGASGVIGRAVQAPARVIEAPFAAINRLAGGVPGRVIGDSPVGGVFGFLGEVVNRVGNSVPALLNSQDADLLFKYRGKPDSFVIPDWGESTDGGLFGIGSRQLTLGEKRAEMRDRGFTDQDFEDLYSGTKGSWDFGDKMIHSSALVDLAGRLTADPTNLLFAPGIAAKIGAKLGVGAIGRAMGQARFRAAADAGLRVGAKAPDITASARAASRGNMLATSQMGMSKMIANAIVTGRDLRGFGGMARGIGAAARAYVRPSGWTTRTGFLKRSAATYGALALAANAPDGLIDGLRQFSRETLSDQPLSNNSFFVLAAAMGSPVTQVGRDTLAEVRGTWWQTIGTDFRQQFKKQHGFTYDEAAKLVGGEDRLQVYMTEAAFSLVRDELDVGLTEAMRRRYATGAMSQYDTSVQYNQLARENIVRMISRGKITPAMIAQRMRDLFENRNILKGSSALIEDAGDLGVRFAMDRDAWSHNVNTWLDTTELLAKRLDLEGEIAPGYAKTYTKEYVASLESSVKDMADNGKIDILDVKRFLSNHELLLGMSERDALSRYLALDNGTVDASELASLLEKTRNHDTTPLHKDYYAEDRLYELRGLMESAIDPNGNAVQQIRDRIDATIDKDTGKVTPGMEQWNDHYNRRLTAEITSNIRRGDSLGEADAVQLQNTLYRELRETLGDGDQVLPGAQQRHDDIVAAMTSLKAKDVSLADALAKLDLEADKAGFDPMIGLPDSEVGLAYRERLNELNQQVREISANYAFKKAPDLSYVPKPGDQLPDWLIREHNVLGEILFDHRFNPIGWFANFTRFLFTPVEGSRMAKDAEQAIYDELIGKGASPKEIQKWLSDMREHAINQNVVSGDLGVRIYGRVNSLLPHDINRHAQNAFKDSKALDAVGPNNFFRVLDKASSRTLRSFRGRIRSGQTKGLLSRALKDEAWAGIYGKYRAGEIAPGIQGTARIATNTLYHIFRFMSDIRWHAMNRGEAAIFGLSKEGIAPGNPFRSRAQKEAAGQPSPATRRQMETPDTLADPTETGWFSHNRIVTGKLSRSFDSARLDSVTDVLKDMWDTDPGLVALRRNFPDADPRDLAQRLDDQWFNFESKGIDKTVREQYAEIFAENGDLAKMGWEARSVIQRISEVNKELYRNLSEVFVGNPNRSNLERVLNSYWLYWPLSYQLKAGRWLVGMLSHRAFGSNTNLLGAWKYNEMKEYHMQQLRENPEYADQFKDKALWQTALMFFPITPEDMGVSLSRPTRILTSWLGITEPNRELRDPISMLGYFATIGPVYTVELMGQIGRTAFPKAIQQGVVFDADPSTPQGGIQETLLGNGVTSSAPITGTGIGQVALPGTQSGSPIEGNPFDIKTFAEGGEYLEPDEFEALMDARAQWESREGV